MHGTWRRAGAWAAGIAAGAIAPTATAVTNPDISVIGQPFVQITDDPAVEDRKRPQFDIGETEIVFDAALNPYARAFVATTFGEEGFGLEEGYLDLNRALPWQFALRAGLYRVGFGQLNPVHPHVLPFGERFGVLAQYLPGDEALADVGVSLSRRLAVGGDNSLLLSADWLQGDEVAIERETSGDPSDPLETGGDDDNGQSRPAFASRAEYFMPLGERSGLEVGLSAFGGTNNVAAGSRTRVFGADTKLRLWTAENAYVLIQAEALHLDRDDAGWDPIASDYESTIVTPTGGYVFADYNFARRYNAGASWEGYQRPTIGEEWDQNIGAFAGYALFEETTVFRLEWRRTVPEGGASFDTFMLRALFSMGPHKVHQF